MLRIHKNAYIDITGLPPKKLLQYFPDLPRFADKFLFGTDWPSVDMRRNAEAVAALPAPPRGHPRHSRRDGEKTAAPVRRRYGNEKDLL